MDAPRRRAQYSLMEEVTPLPPRGAVFEDVRDGGRGLRVSWHHELGCVVLSNWQDDRCVSTARLPVAEVPRLIQVLVAGLAADAVGPTARREPA